MDRGDLFLDDYLFKGEHEEKARQLISIFDTNSGSVVFKSAVELYITAAIIGCVKNRRAVSGKSSDRTLKIMATQFKNHFNDLHYVYQLVLLTAEVGSLDSFGLINRAFRNPESDENRALFDSYVLGGVDELYEYFNIKRNTTYIDFLNGLTDLINDIKEEMKVAGSTLDEILSQE